MRNRPISVCMATYNGSLYLRPQIASILDQLSIEDELVIVDDCSSDSTVEIVRSFKDCRISHLIINKTNRGVNRSFECAMSKAKNQIIFLADQDDIWPDNRVNAMVDVLSCDKVRLVSGNSRYIDAQGHDIDFPVAPLREEYSKSTLKNIFRIFMGSGAYFGCAMAFKKTLNRTILPFPDYIESHDLWIAMASLLDGSSRHLDAIVLLRRVHGKNESIVKRTFHEKVWSRCIHFASIIHLAIRLFGNRK